MKFIKGYKLFESKSEIDKICKKYGIKNYTIKGDGSVDVDGDVDLSHEDLTELPLKFGKVSGSFWCHHNQLTTLEGSPDSVRDFLCNNNQLTTLEGCPNSVGGDFSCHNNQLTTLEGCPSSVGNLWFNNNQLTTLESIPDILGGIIYHNNPIFTVCKGWLINLEKPNMDIIELFKDLDVIVGDKLYWSKLEYFHEEIGVDIPDRSEIDSFYQIID